MSPLTLTHKQMWTRLGISRSKFYELKATGLFDKLESPIPHLYSTEKVDSWIAGRSVHQPREWRSSVRPVTSAASR
jgi:hypothetical protein